MITKCAQLKAQRIDSGIGREIEKRVRLVSIRAPTKFAGKTRTRGRDALKNETNPIRKGIDYLGLLLYPFTLYRGMRHMTRHRAEAKERSSVESGVVSLRVHSSPSSLFFRCSGSFSASKWRPRSLLRRPKLPSLPSRTVLLIYRRRWSLCWSMQTRSVY